MKKFLSLLLAFVLVLGLATPALAEEAGGETENKLQTLRVYKLLQSKDEAGKWDENYGLKGAYTYEDKDGVNWTWTPNEDQYIQYLEGIHFTLYRLEDKGDKKTEVAKGLTNASGYIDFNLDFSKLSEGNYLLVEDPELSTYPGRTTGEEAEQGGQITGYHAVPQTFELPFRDEQDKIVKQVNLFPKNVEDAPSIEKGMDGYEGTEEDDSFDIGQEVPYKVESTVPAGAKYEQIRFTDTMSTGLEFLSDSLTVYLSDNKELGLAEYTKLEKDTDYKLYLQGEEVDGEPLKETFKVVFTSTGLEKVRAITDTDSPKAAYLVLTYRAKIGPDAEVQSDDPLNNKVRINYSNNPKVKESETPKKEDEGPKLRTYGHKFEKLNEEGAEEVKKLNGAEFAVKAKKADHKELNEDKTEIVSKDITGKYLQAYVIEDGREVKVDYIGTTDNDGKVLSFADSYMVKWVDDKDQATRIVSSHVGDEDGQFEVKGVQLGQYTLEETKAPKGYALTNLTQDFTVTKTGYKTGVETTVHNTKISIPQTGGIGSVIFVVVGLAIVAGSAIVLKKRHELA